MHGSMNIKLNLKKKGREFLGILKSVARINVTEVGNIIYIMRINYGEYIN
jgi:hypothetical protein